MKEIFEKFFKENEEKILRLADENTPKNEFGQACILKNDEWLDENEWDEK